MNKTIITDCWSEYHYETETMLIVVEFPNCQTKEINNLSLDIVPDNFNKLSEQEQNKWFDDNQEELYNIALKDAHKQGYILEGELN